MMHGAVLVGEDGGLWPGVDPVLRCSKIPYKCYCPKHLSNCC